MAKYIIKNNLPEKEKELLGRFFDTADALFTGIARTTFLQMADWLAKRYDTNVIFRNQKGKELRGRIQVEIDGMFYYVELYKV